MIRFLTSFVLINCRYSKGEVLCASPLVQAGYGEVELNGEAMTENQNRVQFRLFRFTYPGLLWVSIVILAMSCTTPVPENIAVTIPENANVETESTIKFKLTDPELQKTLQDDIRFAVTRQPHSGSLTPAQGTDGDDLIYRPFKGSSGSDEFEYIVICDALFCPKVSEPAMVRVTVRPRAKRASAEGSQGDPVITVKVKVEDQCETKINKQPDPGHGIAEVVDAQNIEFSPKTDFIGVAEFMYSFKCEHLGNLDSVPAKITVAVKPVVDSFAVNTTYRSPITVNFAKVLPIEVSKPEKPRTVLFDIEGESECGSWDPKRGSQGSSRFTPAAEFFGECGFNYILTVNRLLSNWSNGVVIVKPLVKSFDFGIVIVTGQSDFDISLDIKKLQNYSFDIDEICVIKNGPENSTDCVEGNEIIFNPAGEIPGSDVLKYTIIVDKMESNIARHKILWIMKTEIQSDISENRSRVSDLIRVHERPVNLNIVPQI